MMSKHHRKNYNTGFNLGDLLNNIDITQLVSIISALGGNSRNSSNDQLGAMLSNLNLGDISKKNNVPEFNQSNINSQLAELERKLSQTEDNSSGKGEILDALRQLQNSPDAAKILNSFMNSNNNNNNK
ncbi:hypothetical protein [Clostridium autoethanogenum]|uniref:Uncharacterized protein n=1 Tax=Clostridium autoethanogenum DSM 10061 TaxID=1341692 RepID=A0ABN4BEC2_9CLOT|nr:hypothetical protein [Clostridium autoethanogenum]AGY75692.1 hypothetical protein CAETHG_1467 [Clostridium autoethanogenum DSM 10061]ALU35856.1 Hypothetical protein CLAU_1427 [Clostridium autoethanogenum DSM 10061]OVY52085.1 hypothetical protein WX72_00977 [Clostridium autoethanogenum]